MPKSELTRERVEAILAGCDGVTPGPWTWGLHYIEGNEPGRTNGVSRHIFQDPEDGNDPGLRYWEANARHVARLDPATVRALCNAFLEAERLREENARLRAILELHADVLARQAGPAIERARAALSKE